MADQECHAARDFLSQHFKLFAWQVQDVPFSSMKSVLQCSNSPLEGFAICWVAIIADERHPGDGELDERLVVLEQSREIHILLYVGAVI